MLKAGIPLDHILILAWFQAFAENMAVHQRVDLWDERAETLELSPRAGSWQSLDGAAPRVPCAGGLTKMSSSLSLSLFQHLILGNSLCSWTIRLCVVGRDAGHEGYKCLEQLSKNKVVTIFLLRIICKSFT